MGVKGARQKKEDEKKRLEFKDNRLKDEDKPFFLGEGMEIGKVVSLPYESLAPYKANRDATENLDSLKENIAATGHLIQPLRVTKFLDENGKHIIIAGERRWRCIGMLRKEDPEKWAEVDCVYSAAKDMAEVAFEALADNLNREDVSPADKVKMIDSYYAEFKNTTEQGDLTRLQYKRQFMDKLRALSLKERDLERMASISFNSSKAIKELMMKGQISAQMAEELSSLSKESQDLIAELAEKGIAIDHGLASQFKKSEKEEKNIEKEQQVISRQIASLSKSSVADPSKLDEINKLAEKQKSLAEQKAQIKRTRQKLGTDHKAISTKIKSLSKSVNSIISENPVLTADEKAKLADLLDKLSAFLKGKE